MADNSSIIAAYKKDIERIKNQKSKLPNDSKYISHMQKVVDALESGNAKPTEVFRNIIKAKCYECAGDDHPKTCTVKNCPLYDERPKSGAEKEAAKAEKDVDPEVAKKLKDRAEKARAGRKVTVKEAMEMLLDEANITKMTKGDKQILWSYKTPVAVKIGDTFYVTDTKYSTTTSKHINAFVGDGEKQTKKASWFEKQFGMLD